MEEEKNFLLVCEIRLFAHFTKLTIHVPHLLGSKETTLAQESPFF